MLQISTTNMQCMSSQDHKIERQDSPHKINDSSRSYSGGDDSAYFSQQSHTGDESDASIFDELKETDEPEKTREITANSLQINYKYLKREMESVELLDILHSDDLFSEELLEMCGETQNRRRRNDLLIKEIHRIAENVTSKILQHFVNALHETHQDHIVTHLLEQTSMPGTESDNCAEFVDFISKMRRRITSDIEPRAFIDDLLANDAISFLDHEDITQLAYRKDRVDFILEKASKGCALEISTAIINTYPKLFQEYEQGTENDAGNSLGTAVNIRLHLFHGTLQTEVGSTEQLRQIEMNAVKLFNAEQPYSNAMLEDLVEECRCKFEGLKISSVVIQLLTQAGDSLKKVMEKIQSGKAVDWFMSILDEKDKKYLQQSESVRLIVTVDVDEEGNFNNLQLVKDCLCRLDKHSIVKNKDKLAGILASSDIDLLIQRMEKSINWKISDLMIGLPARTRIEALLNFLTKGNIPRICYCLLEEHIKFRDSKVLSSIIMGDLREDTKLSTSHIKQHAQYLEEELEVQSYLHIVWSWENERSFRLRETLKRQQCRDSRVAEFLKFLLCEEDLTWFWEEVKKRQIYIWEFIVSSQQTSLQCKSGKTTSSFVLMKEDLLAVQLLNDKIVNEVDPLALKRYLDIKTMTKLGYPEFESLCNRRSQVQYLMNRLSIDTICAFMMAIHRSGYTYIESLIHAGSFAKEYACPRIHNVAPRSKCIFKGQFDIPAHIRLCEPEKEVVAVTTTKRNYVTSTLPVVPRDQICNQRSQVETFRAGQDSQESGIYSERQSCEIADLCDFDNEELLASVGPHTTLAGSSSTNVFLSQHIKGRNIMIGNRNSLTDKSITTSNDEENYSPSSAKDLMKLSSENNSMSYAQACSGQNINAYTVIIHNTPQDAETVSSAQKQLHVFLDSVQSFNSGHYILVVEKLHTDMIQHLGSLLLAPWSVILDLDPESRMTGLLSCAEHFVSKRKSLHVVSWQDKDKCNFNENSLYWIGMKGCSDRPGTRTDTIFRRWKAQIKGSFTQILQQLNKFGDSYTKFTVVSLWPRNHTEAQHMQYILEELEENISPSPKMVLVDESISKKTIDEDAVLRSTRLYHGNDMTLVEMSLTGVCRAIANVCKPLTEVSSSLYQLPTNDSTSHTDITDENAQWLKEDLDVLYINNKKGTDYTQRELEKVEDTFLKGGTLPWPWWYHVGPGHVDVERDITKRILDLIENKHITTCRPGCVTMLHNPGSGGTTLSQRVVWSLREKVPCAQVKHRHGLNITDLTEKVKFLSDKTHLPILLLVIGEDEQMVDSIQRFVRDKCTVIVFYVKRSRERIERDEVDWEKSKCKLKSSVSWKEARQLELLYKKQFKTESKQKKITELVNDVEKGQKHTMFEFGLAVHSYNYHGIEPYVRDFLILQDTLQPWQTALAYMSLVFYYGQASVPCKFLAGFLGPDDADRILVFEDFPDEMKEFMVKDVQERKTNMVRITHYYVAKEILDQILTFPNKQRRKPSPQICQESKRRLGSFAVDFIRKAGEIIQDQQATTISYIMTRTFILRDNKAAGENETQTSNKRRPKCSPVLEDVSSSPPYTKRFDIFKQLTVSFPNAAQFRAHLGRLYTICRPEETGNAEKCFKEALDMIFKAYESLEDLPHYIKLDLMHIYHMYGNMMLNCVAQYTGKYLGDIPKKNTSADTFETTADQLLPDVKHACSLFEKCRDFTPIGCEEGFGYIGEIQVRLMFCSFVHFKSGSDVHEYSHNRSTEIAHFVKECYTTLDELFLLCFSSTEPERMDDDSILNCQKWYDALFKEIPEKIVHQKEENVASRRLQIAKIKMKYCSPDAYGFLEQITNPCDINAIVNGFETNFADYENQFSRQIVTLRVIDLDHREWLFAIRQHLFKEYYSIERVLQRVQAWYDQVSSPHSRFYLFVLKSLLGFGSSKHPGDPALLVAAQQLKEDVLKHSKYVTKSRYPREWLGTQTDSIHRLAPGRRFFRKIEGRDIHGIDFTTLEVLKGTICAPNDKPAAGFIHLDLGSTNRVEVKVFFVPAKANRNLKGTAYNNKRVEFVLGFSLSHGYEAFNVDLLGHETCYKCKQNVEKRSCDTMIICPRCHIDLKCKKKPSSANVAHGNGGRKVQDITFGM